MLKKIIMQKILFCFLLSCSINAVVAQQKTIVITNPLTIQRKELVSIPWNKIINAFPLSANNDFKVINATTKKELPYQLEYKGNSQIQNLLVLLNIGANTTVKLQLVTGKPQPVSAKTFCRYVPERKDDFAWENDRIAYRMYGKALENSPAEMAYGVDVWVKRTDSLVINKRYKLGEYHIDHGDGLDYYHVGLTLGAGDVAPFINDTIWFPKNYRHWKILDNGPLRSTFQLSYDEWDAAGRNVKCTKTISIDAGSQLNKWAVSYDVNDNLPLPVAIGIAKRNEAGEMLLDEKKGILAYWEPQHGEDGTTGVGCVIENNQANGAISSIQMQVNKVHLLAATTVPFKTELTYYQGACWDKAGKITSAAAWFDYLNMFQNCLQHPLIISFQ